MIKFLGGILTIVLLLVATCGVFAGEQETLVRKPRIVAPAIKLLIPAHLKSGEPFLLLGAISDEMGLRQISVFLDGHTYATKAINNLKIIDLKDLEIHINIPKPGEHRLLVRAHEASPEHSSQSIEKELAIKVISSLGQPPQVSLSMQKQIAAGKEVNVEGFAADKEGEVKRLTLFLDGKKILERDFVGKKLISLESIPWLIKIDSPGNYVLRLRAFDEPDKEPTHYSDATCRIKVVSAEKASPKRPGTR